MGVSELRDRTKDPKEQELWYKDPPTDKATLLI